jgi:oligopeptide/dipeptide ABC transporter ATP-binding protein
MTSLLEVRDLNLEFKTSRGCLKALNGMSFTVQSGEIFGLVGETGCGKTVTGLSILRLLSRSAKITSGHIFFEGVDLVSLPEEEIESLRGNKIAMIFQDPSTSLNPVFIVGSQIQRVVQKHLKVTTMQAYEKTCSVMDAVGLPDVKRIIDSYPHQLSGGMLQRVMIAMALSCNPRLLIADEPTTSLDVTIQAQILKLLREMQEKFNVSVILITHNLGVIAQSCDNMAVLYGGRAIESGSVGNIFDQPAHPYTQGLMNAIPHPCMRGKKLSIITGTVPPNPGALAGCAFAPRCNFVMDQCLVAAPQLYQVSENHSSACYLSEKKK